MILFVFRAENSNRKLMLIEFSRQVFLNSSFRDEIRLNFSNKVLISSNSLNFL